MRAAHLSATAVVALAAAAVAVLPAGRSAAAGCPATLAGAVKTGAAAQLITVEAPSRSATHAAVRLWRRAGGCWAPAGGPWSARLGRGGVSAHHVEGDGTTPSGVYGLGPVVYGVAPDPGVHYPYHRIVCGDFWNEDPSSPGYNTFHHVPCGVLPPFAKPGDGLWTAPRAYRHFIPIRYNADPVVPGRGSAIFLHADWGSATHGCIALGLSHLETTLRWLRPDAKPLIAIGTRAEIVGAG